MFGAFRAKIIISEIFRKTFGRMKGKKGICRMLLTWLFLCFGTPFTSYKGSEGNVPIEAQKKQFVSEKKEL